MPRLVLGYTRSIVLAVAVLALLAATGTARADTQDGTAAGMTPCEEFRVVVQADAFHPRVDELARRCQELIAGPSDETDGAADIGGDRESVIDALDAGSMVVNVSSLSGDEPGLDGSLHLRFWIDGEELVVTYSAEDFQGALQACEDAGVTEESCRLACAIDLLRGSSTAIPDALAQQEARREHARLLATRRPLAESACLAAGVIYEPHLQQCIYELTVVWPDAERHAYERTRAIALALKLQARERGLISTLMRWQNAIGGSPSGSRASLPVSQTLVLRPVAVSIDGTLPAAVE